VNLSFDLTILGNYDQACKNYAAVHLKSLPADPRLLNKDLAKSTEITVVRKTARRVLRKFAGHGASSLKPAFRELDGTRFAYFRAACLTGCSWYIATVLRMGIGQLLALLHHSERLPCWPRSRCFSGRETSVT
jgi:hypothetical protein